MSYLPIGLVLGCLYALTATGLVVTYNTSGIFNFAHGAEGMFMAFLYWQLSVGWHLNWALSMAIVLFVAAPIMGAFIERAFIRNLYKAPLGVTLVVTLGMLIVLLYGADGIWKPTITRTLPDIVSGQFKIVGVVITWDEVLVLAISVVVAAGLRAFFSFTRAGITMRAVVDDKELAARAGASPNRTAQLSWMLGAFLAALAGILIAVAKLQQLDQFNLTFLIVTGYAAAVIGRLKSYPLTVAGAMLLGLLVAYAVGYLPVNLLTNFQPVIPMGVLLIALLLLPQGRLATAKFGGKTRRLVRLRSSLLLAAAFVAGTWVVSGMLSGGNLIIFGKGMVLGVVMLSLVLLTGYGGQVSLAQMTFAGLGAYSMGKLLGGDSLLGLGAAIVLPAAVGAVLALVVLRLRGLYLALATLAFAYAMDNIFFNKELGVGGILKVGRFAVDSQRGFLLEVAVLFAICAVGVLAIKRGEFGRRLAALNDSEVACASLGMNITTTKVVAFTLAAGIAGLGGALLGGWQHQISPNDVPALFSLIVLLLLAVGGLGTVAGAFAAAMAYALQPTLQAHAPLGISNFPQLLVGVGAVSLGRNPAGIAGYASDAADWVRARRGARAESEERVGIEDRGTEEVGVVRVAG